MYILKFYVQSVSKFLTHLFFDSSYQQKLLRFLNMHKGLLANCVQQLKFSNKQLLLFFLALILVLKIVYALLRNTGQSLCSFTCLPILPIVYTSFNTSLFPQKHVLFELARTCPLFFEIQFHIHFLFRVLRTSV